MLHIRTLRLSTVSLYLLLVASVDASAVHANLQALTPGGAVIASGQTSALAPGPKLAYHDSESESKRMLKDLGFKQNAMAVVTRWFFDPFNFALIVVLFTAAALLGDYLLAKRKIKLDLGNRLLAVSALLAVFQWHASLEQDAMQRYEAEIATANAAETSKAVVTMLPNLYKGECPEDPERNRFVYIHLDNLEYAVERYRFGFASASTTERAVMTFVAHCQEETFRDKARQQVEGYSPDVQVIVEAVIKRIVPDVTPTRPCTPARPSSSPA